LKIIIITGSGGLIGSQAVSFFSDKFDLVIGIDNNMRAYFFGESASTSTINTKLKKNISNYLHFDIDVREYSKLERLFKEYQSDISLILHTAAQPSHDWAAKEPLTDFTINANGTLNLLELTRLHCPKATFIFTSTNKVYGDTPNALPIVEKETRWEIKKSHLYFKGIDEQMSVDQSKHSLFGVSKLAADILVQEYGKYFGLNTGVFRGGCLTGPNHKGVKLHGFLSHLMNCTIREIPYTILGYKGKQVRDNIHSWDLVNMFWYYHKNPKKGEVYNVGGGRHSNCSIIEAISLCEKITEKKLSFSYSNKNRIGDHIWWISDISKFQSHYPKWKYRYNLDDILNQIHQNLIGESSRIL